MTAREDLFACPRCGSDEWSYCDYGGCSKCRPHEERETEDNDAAAVTARKDLYAAARRNRPRWFAVRSLRGLLDVMPAQDASFRGISFGWKGIGLVDFDKQRRRGE